MTEFTKKISTQQREWREKNPEKAKEYAENRKRKALSQDPAITQWQKEHHAMSQARYRQNHKEAHREYMREYMRRKRAEA